MSLLIIRECISLQKMLKKHNPNFLKHKESKHRHQTENFDGFLVTCSILIQNADKDYENHVEKGIEICHG